MVVRKTAKAVKTIKDEFNYFNEFNKTTEYKAFPAEVYSRPKEENEIGKERSPGLGREITTWQAAPKRKREDKSKGLVEKLMQSFKGCAAVATVAVVAVVGAQTVINRPSVEMVDFWADSTYVEYVLSVDELNEKNDYAIVVSTTNEEDITIPVEESGTYRNKVEGLKPEWEYSLSFISFDNLLGQTVLYEKTFQTKGDYGPDISKYSLSVHDITLSGLNEVSVHFSGDGLDDGSTAGLMLLRQDGSWQTVELSQRAIELGQVNVPVEGEAQITVKPVIRLEGGEVLEFSEYAKSFEQTLEADVIVNTLNRELLINLKALQGQATNLRIIDESTGDIVYNDEIYNGSVTIYYDVGTTSMVNYTLYLASDDGGILSNGYSVTFDSSFAAKPTYEFNYKNPGDASVTYNEDGTINVYIRTDFQTDNPDLFYVVTLGETQYRSRDSVFSAIGIPNESYGLSYNVCLEVDGVVYSVYDVLPSGAVNEMSFSNVLYTNVSEGTLNIEFYGYNRDNIDISSIRIVTSSQEEIVVAESDWVYDEDLNMYFVAVDVGSDFEYLDIFARVAQTPEMYGIDEYIGSLFTELSERIYN